MKLFRAWKTTGDNPADRKLSSRFAAVAALLLLTLVVAPFPRAVLTNNLDSGWSAVLSAAHQHGWQFGTDLIFTYGPLGFLTVPYFFPDLFGWRLVVDLAMGLVWSAGVCLLVWRLRWPWRVAAIALVMLVTANIQYGVEDLLMHLGLLCWGMLCLSEPRPRLHLLGLSWVVLFSALAKVSGLVAGSLTLAAVALDLFWRGQRRVSLLLCLGCVLGFAGGWAGLGQQWIQIPAYVGRGLAISGAYAQTMALVPPWLWLLAGVLTAAMGVAAVIVRGMSEDGQQSNLAWRRRLLRTGWLLALVFISWKHGFVRADRHHTVLFFGFMAVLGLVLEGWLAPSGTTQIKGSRRGWSIAVCVVATLGFQCVLYPGYLEAPRVFGQVAANIGMLLRSTAARQPMEEAFDLQRRLAALPDLKAVVGNATVDVFGNFQAGAVLQGWNYRPRPIFQSYAATTAPLMQLNEAFYASKRAPDFVLMELRPIDDRFPPLEDAWVLRDLLTQYQWAGEEGRCALLKHKPVLVSRMVLLREGSAMPGERIDVSGSEAGSLLWLEIDLEPSLIGRVRSFAYQPPEVCLKVWDQSGVKRTQEYRAPAPMLAAGFLASPLLLCQEQLRDFYHGKTAPGPSGYSVELRPRQSGLWENHAKFRLYRMGFVPP